MEFNEPQLPPESHSTTGSIEEEGLTVIVAVEFTAVKVNQTSSSALPVHPANDCVAPTVVAAVFTQVVLTNKLVGLGHKSLAGAGGGLVTQMVNVPEPEPVP